MWSLIKKRIIDTTYESIDLLKFVLGSYSSYVCEKLIHLFYVCVYASSHDKHNETFSIYSLEKKNTHPAYVFSHIYHILPPKALKVEDLNLAQRSFDLLPLKFPLFVCPPHTLTFLLVKVYLPLI